jgi:hypothetical protein
MAHTVRTAHRAAWVRRGLLAALLGLLALSAPRTGSAGDPPATAKPGEKAAKAPGPFEVRFTDNGTLKLTVRDEHVEVITRYGRLQVPVADIRRIEFATRIPDDIAQRAEDAAGKLGHADFKQRQAATAELRNLREKAYPALLKAAKSSDQEVARRAEELLEWLQTTLTEEQLQVRPQDIVYTDDMKVAGRIAGLTLKVQTQQFGEQQVKLADLHSLRSLNSVEAAAAESKNVLPDPGGLTNYQNQIGKTFYFRVTSAVTGAVWGTDVYTTDSSLATVAVHAGVLQAGQTGVVKVTILPPLPAYNGSTRNGVTSSAFGMYPGSYRVAKVGPAGGDNAQ